MLSTSALRRQPNGLEKIITSGFGYFKIRTFLSRHPTNFGTRGTASRPMTPKSIVWLIVALGLLAVSWGLRERVLDTPANSTSRQSSGREAPPAGANSGRDERAFARTPRSSLGEISNKAATDTPLVSKSLVSSSEHPSSAGTTSSQESLGNSPERTDEIEPSSVIGRPFPVSKSIENNCKLLLKYGPDGSCDFTYKFLKEMAEEPRDPAWANRMEAELRHLVTTERPGFEIRALECRESRCALEVASVMGLFHLLESDSPINRQLTQDLGLFGHEHDPSGARITVTLHTYSRRR